MLSSWCSVDITPDWNVPLAGTGPGRTSRAVADRLEANLWLLAGANGSLIVGAVDTLFVGTRALTAIASRSGVAPEQICLVASHSHNTPSVSPEVIGVGECDENYLAFMIDRLSAGIRRLIETAPKPIEARFGRVTTDLNTNRRRRAFVVDYYALLKTGRLSAGRRIALAENLDGPVDRNIYTLLLEQGGGEPPLLLWCFAAHPAFFPKRTCVSADYPGEIRRVLRERLGPEAAILYMPGLAGSAVPRIPFRFGPNWRTAFLRCLPFYPMLNAFSEASYERWCSGLAKAVHAAIDSATLRKLAPFASISRARVEKVMIGSCQGAPDIDLEVCRVSLGDELSLTLFSGEMLGEWVPLLETETPQRGIVSSYLAGYPFYVPNDQAKREGGYEVDGFRASFGIKAEFAESLDARVIEAVRSLDE